MLKLCRNRYRCRIIFENYCQPAVAVLNSKKGNQMCLHFRASYAPTFSVTIFRGPQRWFPPKLIENSLWAIQNTFRHLEKHSKRRYKMYICSVILRELESLRNYQGFSLIFPKILDAIERFTKVRLFLFLSPLINLVMPYPRHTRNCQFMVYKES